MLIRIALSFALSACCTFAPVAAQGSFPGTGSKADWMKANGFHAEGNLLMEKKKYAEAAVKYQQAIDIYPSDHNYQFNLGLALKKKGDGLLKFVVVPRWIEQTGGAMIDQFAAGAEIGRNDRPSPGVGLENGFP